MDYLSYGRHALQWIIRNANPQSSSYSVGNPQLYMLVKDLDTGNWTQRIDKLGKAGETVKVASGYFHNHLMPKLLAVPNMDKFAYLIREQGKVARQLCVNIALDNLLLPTPLSTVGEYEVPLLLPRPIPLSEGTIK